MNALGQLLTDSLNANSTKSSFKRLSGLISLLLFVLQVVDLIVRGYVETKESTYSGYSAERIVALALNALVFLYTMGAIKDVDKAFAAILQQKQVTPGEAIVNDAEQTLVQAEEISTENIENANAQMIKNEGYKKTDMGMG